jgi:hypothetical protein
LLVKYGLAHRTRFFSSAGRFLSSTFLPVIISNRTTP